PLGSRLRAAIHRRRGRLPQRRPASADRRLTGAVGDVKTKGRAEVTSERLGRPLLSPPLLGSALKPAAEALPVPIDPRAPTPHHPGSPGKLRVLRARARAELPLFLEVLDAHQPDHRGPAPASRAARRRGAGPALQDRPAQILAEPAGAVAAGH